MSTSIMVLADGTQIKLTGGAALGHMKVHYVDRAAMVADWEKLTPESLKVVQIKTDGTVTGNYEDLILESETSALAADGEVDTAWKIREKTEMERMQDEIAALKESRDVHEGAIFDIAEMTSALAEKAEGGQA